MTQSQYSLSWDSYKSNICSGFSSLQQNGEFVDMTIAADGHLVKVHQVLVALASPFLKELIASAPCQHPVIFLNNVSHKVLSYLLEYIYTGEVVVPSDNLPGFIEAAKSLHVRGLEGVFSGEEHSVASNDDNSYPIIVSHHETENVPKTRGSKRKATTSIETLDSSMEEQPASEDNSDNSENSDAEPNEPSPQTTNVSTIRLQDDFSEINTYVVTDVFAEITPFKADSRWFSRDGEFYVVSRSRKGTLTLRCGNSKTCAAHWLLSSGKAGPVKGQHNHEPTPWVPNRNAMFQALKRNSSTPNITLKEIYDIVAAREESVDYVCMEKENGDCPLKTKYWNEVPYRALQKGTRRKKSRPKVAALPRSARKVVVVPENKLKTSNQSLISIKSDSTDFSQDFPDLGDSGTHDSDDGMKLELATDAETERVKAATSNLLFTVSIRGSLQVILNRYIYNLNSTTTKAGLRRWRCVDYRNNKCTAFLVTKGSVVINRANPHTHTFHDKKILAKIEKKAVFSALDDVEAYRDKEKELEKQDQIEEEHFDEEQSILG